jgi:hypothetical protein
MNPAHLLATIAFALSFAAAAHADLDEQLTARVAERRTELDQSVPAILQLQKEINQKDKYFKNKTKKDAGPILNARVPWLGTDDKLANKKAYAQYLVSLGDTSPKSLELPQQLIDQLKQAGPDFLKKAKTFDLKGIDFAWITEMKKYDFWEIGENSPWIYLDRFSFTSAPFPNLVLMTAWARLRLIKGIQEHDLARASDEVQHLAKLVHSTETLVGAVTSLHIVHYASQAEESEHRPALGGAKFVEHAKNYFMHYLNVASNPLLNPQSLAGLLKNPGPGFCAITTEAGQGILFAKPLLETDVKETVAQFTKLIETSKACRWVNLRKAWSGDARYVLFFDSLPKAPAETRKKALEALKESFTASDYQALVQDVASPRWPQHLGYAMALLRPAPPSE